LTAGSTPNGLRVAAILRWEERIVERPESGWDWHKKRPWEETQSLFLEKQTLVDFVPLCLKGFPVVPVERRKNRVGVRGDVAGEVRG
jgi:hypothetical protein